MQSEMEAQAAGILFPEATVDAAFAYSQIMWCVRIVVGRGEWEACQAGGSMWIDWKRGGIFWEWEGSPDRRRGRGGVAASSRERMSHLWLRRADHNISSRGDPWWTEWAHARTASRPARYCVCGQDDQTAACLLRVCPVYDNQMRKFCSWELALHSKLYGSRTELLTTVEFIKSPRLTLYTFKKPSQE